MFLPCGYDWAHVVSMHVQVFVCLSMYVAPVCMFETNIADSAGVEVSL